MSLAYAHAATMHNPTMRRIIPRAGLWSALAFVLNLTWEIAHVRMVGAYRTLASRTET